MARMSKDSRPTRKFAAVGQLESEQPTRLRSLRGASPLAVNCLYSDG